LSTVLSKPRQIGSRDFAELDELQQLPGNA